MTDAYLQYSKKKIDNVYIVDRIELIAESQNAESQC